MSNSSEQDPINVCIVYPTDPGGTMPGGIETFVRGELACAPRDINYSVVGITTDPAQRPIGKWTTCRAGDREYRFLPVIAHEVSKKLPLLPVVVRFMAALWPKAKDLEFDVLEIHRIEPLALFRKTRKPVTAVLHQNMKSLYSENAEIRWALFPSLYFWVENRLMPRVDCAFCVRTDAIEDYRERFAHLRDACWPVPTWADPAVFHPVAAGERGTLRGRIAAQYELEDDKHWLTMVGRLSFAKNPSLLLQTFALLRERGRRDTTLLIVGEGPLRDEMVAQADKLGLGKSIRFLGFKAPEEVAELLRVSDLFVMSSAYEGMPMAAIEALASGIPVASTRVGEIEHVVRDRLCGRLSDSHSAEDLANAVGWCLEHLEDISGQPCVDAAGRYSPAIVLERVYDNYRRLARDGAAATSQSM